MCTVGVNYPKNFADVHYEWSPTARRGHHRHRARVSRGTSLPLWRWYFIPGLDLFCFMVQWINSFIRQQVMKRVYCLAHMVKMQMDQSWFLMLKIKQSRKWKQVGRSLQKKCVDLYVPKKHTGWHIRMVTTYCWLSSNSSGSWWATTVATYCPGRMVKNPKSQREVFSIKNGHPVRSSLRLSTLGPRSYLSDLPKDDWLIVIRLVEGWLF